MNKLHTVKAALFLLLLAPPVFSAAPDGAAYLQGNNDTALILVHGRGKYPTWKVVEPLRIAVNDQLNYHTLSIQVPNDDKNWKEYADDFPETYVRIKNAIRFLQKEKRIANIYLMGHSMGSRMVSAFLSTQSPQPIQGLIIVGCRNNGGTPFNCLENVEGLSLPILDIWGGASGKDANAASARESLKSASFTQIEIEGADHKLKGYDDEFTAAVIGWLKKH